jgi:hypothetical protein
MSPMEPALSNSSLCGLAGKVFHCMISAAPVTRNRTDQSAQALQTRKTSSCGASVLVRRVIMTPAGYSFCPLNAMLWLATWFGKGLLCE